MIIDGLSGSEVSKKLGVHMPMLYRWKEEHLKELDGTSRSEGKVRPTEMAKEIGRLRKQLDKSDRIAEILRKTVGYFAEEFDLNDMCEALVIHRWEYSSWRDGNALERKLADEMIKEAILRIHDEAKGRYEHRPIHAYLKEEEVNCGRDRTLRLMNELGVISSQKKRFKPLGTDSNHSFGYSPNLLRELRKPEKSDKVWVVDTTYLDCEDGWMCLAIVMDLYSRRIIGWSISDRNNTALICEALRAAVLNRGAIQLGIIHHSDRGSTYASHEYRSLMASE
ncbi:IS3 family transposase, partial [Verrucomicrobia bacterium]|nr:IS3 family transposase [Verrucomicrobiota bacterium]